MPQLEDDQKTLDRLCGRLRSAPEARLVRTDERLSGDSVADAVHEAAVWAAAAQGIDQQVPRLHPLASADQLSVVGGDFLDWVASADGRAAALQEWRGLVERLRVAV
ncbi:MAG: hypothetical protein LH645_00180 [Actinomycetia bacterium]|nr:hypothetical protein [Actinomycetes bacterium]